MQNPYPMTEVDVIENVKRITDPDHWTLFTEIMMIFEWLRWTISLLDKRPIIEKIERISVFVVVDSKNIINRSVKEHY